jgi:hypothetical protein
MDRVAGGVTMAVHEQSGHRKSATELDFWVLIVFIFLLFRSLEAKGYQTDCRTNRPP